MFVVNVISGLILVYNDIEVKLYYKYEYCVIVVNSVGEIVSVWLVV